MKRKTSLQRIASERRDHFSKHGRTVKSDAIKNPEGQLSVAVMALLHGADDDDQGRYDLMPESWNKEICAKMVSKPYKERLEIAGSLILAELDRIDFMNSKEGEIDYDDQGFEEIVLPVIDWLCATQHPHTTVIITPTDAQLLEGVRSTGEILNFVKD